jgi:hypothetical protein
MMLSTDKAAALLCDVKPIVLAMALLNRSSTYTGLQYFVYIGLELKPEKILHKYGILLKTGILHVISLYFSTYSDGE